MKSEFYKVIIESTGRQEWRQNGLVNRKDGPAVVYPNGTEYWYLNGIRHRLDGPAVTYHDGRKEYWINGIFYTETNFKHKNN